MHCESFIQPPQILSLLKSLPLQPSPHCIVSSRLDGWHSFFTSPKLPLLKYIYCKQGNIHWAKLLRIPPNDVFHRKPFAVPFLTFKALNNAIIRSLYNLNKYSCKTFVVLLKTMKNAKVQPSKSFPVCGSYCNTYVATDRGCNVFCKICN